MTVAAVRAQTCMPRRIDSSCAFQLPVYNIRRSRLKRSDVCQWEEPRLPRETQGRDRGGIGKTCCKHPHVHIREGVRLGSARCLPPGKDWQPQMASMASTAVVGPNNNTYARRLGQHRVSDPKGTDVALPMRTDGQRTGICHIDGQAHRRGVMCVRGITVR